MTRARYVDRDVADGDPIVFYTIRYDPGDEQRQTARQRRLPWALHRWQLSTVRRDERKTGSRTVVLACYRDRMQLQFLPLGGSRHKTICDARSEIHAGALRINRYGDIETWG